MTTTKAVLRVGVPLVAVAAIAAVVISMVSAQNAPAWIDQDENWAANKQKLQAFGERFETSEALYEALKQAAARRTGRRPGSRWPNRPMTGRASTRAPRADCSSIRICRRGAGRLPPG